MGFHPSLFRRSSTVAWDHVITAGAGIDLSTLTLCILRVSVSVIYSGIDSLHSTSFSQAMRATADGA